MAKTKKNIEVTEENFVSPVKDVEEEVIPAPVPAQSGPSYEDLMAMVQSLASEVASLKKGTPSSNNGNDERLMDLLSSLSNRKQDREVTIVHNRELIGGITTHIDLSNISLDFRKVGETRLISWQQFEELSSKYRSFFDGKVLLLGPNEQDLADNYGLPIVNAKKNLTHKDIDKLPSLSPAELESFINSLSEEDKNMVFTYWIGKCYTREEGFYDRVKIGVLDRLSNGKFETITTVMNGDDRNKMSSK